MLQLVHDELEEVVHIFGYTKDDPNAQKTNTEFFDYKGKAKQSSLDQRSEFLKLNEIAWQRRFDMKSGKKGFKPFTINAKNQGYNVISELDLTSLSSPMDHISMIQ